MSYPRKQGPVLPTLVVTVFDKERKRRSSRAAGLISGSKDASTATIMFRTPPDDHHLSLHEWARFIMFKKGPPMSPDSLISPLFSNPFSPACRDTPEFPPAGGQPPYRADHRALHHKPSLATYSTGNRERPTTLSSESLSLRSKKSDISSPSSNANYAQPPNFAPSGQNYTAVHPGDLPSPMTSVGEYQGDLIEGWTSAQGRSSTMSSPARRRDSLSSQARQASTTDSSSPPGPRETILDRAFQLRIIPGVGKEIPGEEKLSSLARFDALMREADERRRRREEAARVEHAAMRSAFEDDDSSEGEEVASDGAGGSGSLYYDHAREPEEGYEPHLIAAAAQRALDFISSRSPPRTPTATRPSISRIQTSYHPDMATPAPTQLPPPRPHTAHAKSRPAPSHRVQSTPQLPTVVGSPSLPPSAEKVQFDGNTLHPCGDQRQSGSSPNRLSFTEFTKRLSSTSSLLLSQTNASGGSSHGSSEADTQSASTPRATSLTFRRSGFHPSLKDGEHDEKQCGWRASGMMATDGGFF